MNNREKLASAMGINGAWAVPIDDLHKLAADQLIAAQERIRRLEAALAVSTEKAKSVAYKVHYIEKEQYDRDCEGMHYMPSWGSLPKRERRIRVQSIKKAMRDTFKVEESNE